MNARSHWKTILAIGAVLVALIVAIAGAVYVVTVKAPSDLAHNAKEGAFDTAAKAYDFGKKIAKDVSDALRFTPRVQIQNGPVVVAQRTQIRELATATQNFSHSYSWSHTWLGSTKTIVLEGEFTAKAGFDLRKPFTLSVDEKSHEVTARMPEPELLSVELRHYKIIADEDGWWNTISAQDREDALNALLVSARERERSSGILTEAQKALDRQLEELLKKSGAPSVNYEGLRTEQPR